MPYLKRHVLICTNRRPPGNPRGCCAEQGGEAIRDRFKVAVGERGLKGTIRANQSGCLDQCEHGAVVLVYPEQIWYGGVKVEDVDAIVEHTVMRGEVIERLLISGQEHLAGLPRAAEK